MLQLLRPREVRVVGVAAEGPCTQAFIAIFVTGEMNNIYTFEKEKREKMR